MMKIGTAIPYLKKVKKYKSRDTSLDFADIHISLEISNFCYIEKYKYRFHFNTKFVILLTLFESLNVVLINNVAILMMSAKLATLGLLKISIFKIKFMIS